jgi:hypothetical protein
LAESVTCPRSSAVELDACEKARENAQTTKSAVKTRRVRLLMAISF